MLVCDKFGKNPELEGISFYCSKEQSHIDGPSVIENNAPSSSFCKTALRGTESLQIARRGRSQRTPSESGNTAPKGRSNTAAS